MADPGFPVGGGGVHPLGYSCSEVFIIPSMVEVVPCFIGPLSRLTG